MTDETTLPFAYPGEPETAITTRTSKHRHVYDVDLLGGDPRSCRCGVVQDPARSHRGRSSNRFGKDQERRIERIYGPRKVGEFGDAVDLIGRDFMWQSKATRGLPPLWLALVDESIEIAADAGVLAYSMAMGPLLRGKMPLIIRSFVRIGVPTRDWIWVPTPGWAALYGGGWSAPWRVMSGAHFLEQHGRDEP